jgi:propionate CoA-transferase
LALATTHPIFQFVQQVEHVTYSGRIATMLGQPALYITERAVFALRPDGLELLEIAPGVDLQQDILSKMAFKPIINAQPKLMDARIFHDQPMGLKSDITKHC